MSHETVHGKTFQAEKIRVCSACSKGLPGGLCSGSTETRFHKAVGSPLEFLGVRAGA